MGSDSNSWWKGVLNELRRLDNNIDNRVRATNTIELVVKVEVTRGCTVTYKNFVYDYLPLKSEPFKIRLTVGG